MAEEKNQEKKNTYKVVLIGESGVGKTCIMAQFIKNKFDPNTITSATSQFFLKNLEIDGTKITFHFWDTAGQEKYRSLTRIFYKDAHVIVLVYDITDKGSFEKMKNYWYEEAINLGKKNVLFAVVANKSDLYEHREIPDDDGEDFAKKIGAIFVATSAKNDSGIIELFDSIGQRLLNKSFNYFSNEKKDKINNKKIDEEKIQGETINIEKIQEEKKEIIKEDVDEDIDNPEKRKSIVITRKTHRETEKKRESHCCLFG